jgi:hypothetical protein
LFFTLQPAMSSGKPASGTRAQRPGLGDDLGVVVGLAIDRIREFPDAYPEVLPTIRRAVLSRFPYSLFYRRRPGRR